MFTITRYKVGGFAGSGWAVQDASGEVVYTATWRIDCLEWVAEREDA